MASMFDYFPVFEANQVLTSGSLNAVRNYLDEETRLTRSHLIGIGIVCGLDIRLDVSSGPSIHLSKGCGVTSEGYLIIEPEDVSLVAYRPYTLPTEIAYLPFRNAATKADYPLWEMFPAGEPNTTALSSPASFLDDKVVVLFLELNKQGLRSCSPNDCDDKGAEVVATVRRLLIGMGDLEKMIAAAGALGSGLTASDLDAALSAKLNLSDIRVARFDVPNTGPVTSNDVYAGFLQVFLAAKLAQQTQKALSAAYAVFKPLLQDAYPGNPFGTFNASFGFLDNAPTSSVQVRFLQYYVDLFEDLVRAYDEFRWKGAELLCACCPPDDLFPRHLMLGLLRPETSKSPGNYRQPFLPSPAVGCCAAHTRELLQLFARLVEMAARFSNAPSLPGADAKARIDPQIRITPSVLGDKALQARAIPYYYRQDGTPPLYQVWNEDRTRRNRANQNLSYRYDEYNPAAPAFVSNPLQYDIEPYDFLRIEGHLGKDYQSVLNTLLQLKADYRLPVDVIALRTGAYDDNQPVNLKTESARFQDLETLYDTLREELLSSLAAGAMNLYDVPVANSQRAGGVPKLPLLKNYAPNYRYPAGSVGATYEQHLQAFQATPYIDVNQKLVSDPAFVGEVIRVHCILFATVNDLRPENYAHVVCIYYFSKLAEILPSALNGLAYGEFENKYQDLLALARYFRSQAMAAVPADLQAFVPQEELIDEFDHVLFSCKLEAIKAVNYEYVKRLGALKKRQFLSNFLQQHPGIQHKAGVPMGGTFILVYHQDPPPPAPTNVRVVLNTALFAEALSAQVEKTVKPTNVAVEISQMAALAAKTDVRGLALTDAIERVGSNRALANNPDISFIIGSLTGRIPMFGARAPQRTVGDEASKIIAATVNELADGTVIADFFLPYKVSSDCPGVEFVLAKTPPSFNATADCTNAQGIATVTVAVKGGTAPFDVAVDQGAYEGLGETLSLPAGTHTLTIRDAEGLESTPRSLFIPPALTIGTPEFACDGTKYTASFEISGGTTPYVVNGTALPENQSRFTTDLTPSGTSVSVTVKDSRGCGTETSFTHTCPPACGLPCEGIALRRGFRFWVPDPDPNNPYRQQLRFSKVRFIVESASGTSVDLSAPILTILRANAAELTVQEFPKTVNAWLDSINKIIASERGLNDGGTVRWLTVNYEPASPGRLGTLWVEYFECLRFDIQMTVTIVRESASERLQASYSPEGTVMTVNDATATIPPFEGTRIDKCKPGTPAEELCPKQLRITLKVDHAFDGMSVNLTVTPSDDPGFTYLWEVQDATPATGNGDKFTTTFRTPGTKLVTVTAYTKAGCLVTASKQIVVRG